MDDDYDVEEFETKGSFIKKEELEQSGPLRLRIEHIEKRPGFKDGNGTPKPELVLVSTDGRRFPLRAKTNLDEVKIAYGRRTVAWIGKLIEVYVDPSVRNPQGARVGGMRVRIPVEDDGPLDFRSDLEDEDVPS